MPKGGSPMVLTSPKNVSAVSPFVRSRLFYLFEGAMTEPCQGVILKTMDASGKEIRTVLPVRILRDKDIKLHRFAARAILGDLERRLHEIWNPERLGYYFKRSASSQEILSLKQEGERLGCKWSLASKWTSFVALEEQEEIAAAGAAGGVGGAVKEADTAKAGTDDLGLLRPRNTEKQRLLLAAATLGAAGALSGQKPQSQTLPDTSSASVEPSSDTGSNEDTSQDDSVSEDEALTLDYPNGSASPPPGAFHGFGGPPAAFDNTLRPSLSYSSYPAYRPGTSRTSRGAPPPPRSGNASGVVYNFDDDSDEDDGGLTVSAPPPLGYGSSSARPARKWNYLARPRADVSLTGYPSAPKALTFSSNSIFQERSKASMAPRSHAVVEAPHSATTDNPTEGPPPSARIARMSNLNISSSPSTGTSLTGMEMPMPRFPFPAPASRPGLESSLGSDTSVNESDHDAYDIAAQPPPTAHGALPRFGRRKGPLSSAAKSAATAVRISAASRGQRTPSPIRIGMVNIISSVEARTTIEGHTPHLRAVRSFQDHDGTSAPDPGVSVLAATVEKKKKNRISAMFQKVSGKISSFGKKSSTLEDGSKTETGAESTVESTKATTGSPPVTASANENTASSTPNAPNKPSTPEAKLGEPSPAPIHTSPSHPGLLPYLYDTSGGSTFPMNQEPPPYPAYPSGPGIYSSEPSQVPPDTSVNAPPPEKQVSILDSTTANNPVSAPAVPKPPATTPDLPAPPKSSISPAAARAFIKKIIQYQHSNGAFMFPSDAEIKTVLGLEFYTGLKTGMPSDIPHIVNITALVVALLEAQFDSCRGLWVLVVEKAKGFVVSESKDTLMTVHKEMWASAHGVVAEMKMLDLEEDGRVKTKRNSAEGVELLFAPVV